MINTWHDLVEMSLSEGRKWIEAGGVEVGFFVAHLKK